MATKDEEAKAKKEAEEKAAKEAAAKEAEEKKKSAKSKTPKTYKPDEKLGKLVATTAGLPNTCSETGEPVEEGYWFAEHDDAARSGVGVCQAVAEKKAKS